MLRWDDSARTLELGVHDLIEAGPPSGDLALQAGFAARVRMRAGADAHRRWAARRAEGDPSFSPEVTVRYHRIVGGWEVTVTGRIDGLCREGDAWVVEEVKTTAWPLAAGLPERAIEGWTRQVRLYQHFLADRGIAAMGRLVLVSLADGAQRHVGVEPDLDFARWLDAQLVWLVRQREDRIAWHQRRRLSSVPFPHDRWRPGQRELANAAEESLARARHLLVTAPTGLGKTAAVLYAALRVAYSSDLRVMVLTARTTQQRLFEETLRALATSKLPLRAVSIRAREKACLNEVVACRADACRFAAGYHDKVRVTGVLDAVSLGPTPRPDDVSRVGEEHEVCPFALALDLAERADVVVGDLNYAFDPAVRLDALSRDPGAWLLVVDEAHNLPERAMESASPELPLALARAAAESVPAGPFQGLADDAGAWLSAGVALGERAVALEELGRDRVRDLAGLAEDLALDHALSRAAERRKDPTAVRGPDPWIDLYRALLRLRAAVERGGEETVALWRSGGLKVLCRDPSALLAPAFAECAGSVCMSATLSPPAFYRSLLGLDPERTDTASFGSPFPPEHRRVVVVPSVSTRFRDRDRDRASTARIVSDVVAAVPGNVAVFFSSFAHKDAVVPLIALGGRPAIDQARRMDESERDRVLRTMAKGHGHVLLAVLGGIFGEGVDLPGAALLAAVIVGPALPQVGPERELLRQWFERRYEQGFRYAFLVPGMSRVVQAAGRVIRTPTDRGAIVLVDRRFVQRDYQSFFPDDWEPVRTDDPAAALRGFWAELGAYVPEQ